MNVVDSLLLWVRAGAPQRIPRPGSFVGQISLELSKPSSSRQVVNRGANPPYSLTALFFTVMVTVVGYWAGKIITPLLCKAQPDFPPGFSTPRRFSCPPWL
jgi:hypothetical protein